MGKAVLSTTLGAEGLPVTHDENIVLADSPDAFARAAVRLLRSPELRARLGGAARAMVERDASWATAAEQFHASMSEVV